MTLQFAAIISGSHTVQQITSDGIAQIIYTEGNTQQINLSGRQYVDYAWVNTTYGSQGKTADRVMALMDSTTTNRESFYVTVSRAKYHLALYTADKVALSQWAEVSKAKENTSDYVPLAQVVEKEVVSAPRCELTSQRLRYRNTSPTATQLIVKTVTNPPESKQIVVPDEITQQKTDPLEIKVPPSKTENQPSVKQKYLDLWQHYSQGLTVNDPVNLDLQVARRALKDGRSQKDIALMLTVGSSIVQKIIRGQSKRQAIIYVNQTIRRICSSQKVKFHHHSSSSERRLELE